MPHPPLLRTLLCMLTFAFVAGCSTPCLDLANQICKCQPDTTSQSNCQTNASNAGSTFTVRSQDNEYCQQKLDEGACDCNKLNTPEGRANCGLSYPAADAGTN